MLRNNLWELENQVNLLNRKLDRTFKTFLWFSGLLPVIAASGKMAFS